MEEYIHFLNNHIMIAYIMLALFSVCVGSFLNVVIYRFPLILKREWTLMCREYLEMDTTTVSIKKVGLVFPRSYCPACQKQLTWWQNIPLLSYLCLRAKCANCGNKISIRYPLIEGLTMFLSLLVLHRLGISLNTAYALLYTWTLIALAMIDIDTQLLPDNITLPFLWLGLIINTTHAFVSLENAVLTAAACYLTLWLFIKLFTLITGKDGMGFGDVKLFAALGAWLGWQSMPLVLLIASLVGSIIGLIILKTTKKGKDTPLAFGQYLCLAGFIALLYGNNIISWYLDYSF